MPADVQANSDVASHALISPMYTIDQYKAMVGPEWSYYCEAFKHKAASETRKEGLWSQIKEVDAVMAATVPARGLWPIRAGPRALTTTHTRARPQWC